MAFEQCCRRFSQALVSDISPIYYDALFSEYRVRLLDGGYGVINNCPWCGKDLPQSNRPGISTDVSETDLSEIGAISANAKTIDEIVALLGTPSETIELTNAEPGEEFQRVVKQHSYNGRWSTADLVVLEKANATIEILAVPSHPMAEEIAR